MEALIIVLVVALGYLTFHMKKSDSQDEEFDRLKDSLDDALVESPYKVEPVVSQKKKTRKRIAKKVVLKKPKVVKKKTVKKKVKTKRKTK